MISNIFRDLRFSLNQLLKSADKWYIEILQNIKNLRVFRCIFSSYFEFSLWDEWMSVRRL